MPDTPLVRPHEGRLLAGVCAGLSAHLGLPAAWVRVGMIALTLLGGAGPLLYAWFWALVPAAGETEPVVPLRRALVQPGLMAASDSGAPAPETEPDQPDQPDSRAGDAGEGQGAPPALGNAAGTRRRGRVPVAEILLGLVLLIAGAGLVLDRLGVDVRLQVVLPGLAVLVGVGLTWWQIVDRGRSERNQLPRVLAALALVAVGMLMFFVTARQPSVWTVVAAALAVLAGVAFALAPWLLRLNRELVAERSARAREAERAEIAAHLHDSVLQTLALIQQRSGAGSEVARIARSQERELREWLFRTGDGGSSGPRGAVVAELRDHAAALELAHGVRFEVVSVGDGERVQAPEPLVAAAREAMLNAARHAGGDVTVFVEVTADRFSVDVADRGPGLDPDDLPAGRMGVRESILGRMERAGGSAKIVPGPGGGTSVRLAMPRMGAAEAGADLAAGA